MELIEKSRYSRASTTAAESFTVADPTNTNTKEEEDANEVVVHVHDQGTTKKKRS
jgi:hypothetical protein